MHPLHLRDGRRVWLRPLQPADVDGLIALRERLSDETVRRRFLRLLPPCDGVLAAELANVDQVQRVAIAAVSRFHNAAPIVGVGRFHIASDGRAELGLLVEDAYQQLGLGRELLARLFEEAKRRTLSVLFGYVLYDNQPALRLLRTSGHPLRVAWHGGDVLDVQLDV